MPSIAKKRPTFANLADLEGTSCPPLASKGRFSSSCHGKRRIAMVLPTPPVSPQAPPASVSAGPVSAGPAAARPTSVHRIRTVRLQQGVSLRTAARQTRTDIRQLRLQEQETTDLRLSDLRKWQRALDVPLAELLVEPAGTLSPPIMERARMVRLMKTAAALMERAPTPAVHRMANMLVEQAGYSKVYNVTEGIVKWIKDGNSVIR